MSPQTSLASIQVWALVLKAKLPGDRLDAQRNPFLTQLMSFSLSSCIPHVREDLERQCREPGGLKIGKLKDVLAGD